MHTRTYIYIQIYIMCTEFKYRNSIDTFFLYPDTSKVCSMTDIQHQSLYYSTSVFSIHLVKCQGHTGDVGVVRVNGNICRFYYHYEVLLNILLIESGQRK